MPGRGTLDKVRASADYEVFEAAEEDESVIERLLAAQREEIEREIDGLKAEAERIREEAGNWWEYCHFEK